MQRTALSLVTHARRPSAALLVPAVAAFLLVLSACDESGTDPATGQGPAGGKSDDTKQDSAPKSFAERVAECEALEEPKPRATCLLRANDTSGIAEGSELDYVREVGAAYCALLTRVNPDIDESDAICDAIWERGIATTLLGDLPFGAFEFSPPGPIDCYGGELPDKDCLRAANLSVRERMAAVLAGRDEIPFDDASRALSDSYLNAAETLDEMCVVVFDAESCHVHTDIVVTALHQQVAGYDHASQCDQGHQCEPGLCCPGEGTSCPANYYDCGGGLCCPDDSDEDDCPDGYYACGGDICCPA